MSAESPPPPPAPSRTGILLPVASAQQAAQLASVASLSADAVPDARGVMLLSRQPAEDTQVGRLSRLLRGSDVLVLRMADERVDVQRWRAGRLLDTPSYGEVGGVTGDAERVLLGWLPVAEAEGVVAAEDVDSRAAARAVMAGLAGPVKPWEIAVTAILIALAAFLVLAAAFDLVSGSGSAWDVVRTVVWVAVAAVLALRLRGLLSRRRRERATTQ